MQVLGSKTQLLHKPLVKGFSFQSSSPEGQILVNGETTSAESESGSTDGSEK